MISFQVVKMFCGPRCGLFRILCELQRNGYYALVDGVVNRCQLYSFDSAELIYTDFLSSVSVHRIPQLQ